jgi:simple sugar transport system permease protein
MRLRAALLDAVPALLAVVAALAVASALVWLVGDDPILFFQLIGQSAFGSIDGLGYTVFYATPLICTGLAFAMAHRCGLFNIGAEGQMVVGALAAGTVALAATDLGALAGLLALIGGVLAGAGWGGLAGYLRARFGAHEVITTIMLNVTAVALASYVTERWLRAPGDQVLESAAIDNAARLPRFGLLGVPDRIPLNVTVLLALAAAVAVWLLLFRTRVGYEIRVAGISEAAARYAGIDVGLQIVIAMAVSGGLAALAGVNETLGYRYRYYHDFSPGYGYSGIAVALLGRSHPAGIVLAALLFGAMTRAGLFVDIFTDHVSREIMLVIQGLVILFVASERWVFDRLRSRAEAGA